MIRVTAVDGPTFSGESAADVVRAMRDEDWHREQPKGEYMDDVVHRVESMTGQTIGEPITPTSFLAYLNDMELISIAADPG